MELFCFNFFFSFGNGELNCVPNCLLQSKSFLNQKSVFYTKLLLAKCRSKCMTCPWGTLDPGTPPADNTLTQPRSICDTLGNRTGPWEAEPECEKSTNTQPSHVIDKNESLFCLCWATSMHWRDFQILLYPLKHTLTQTDTCTHRGTDTHTHTSF